MANVEDVVAKAAQELNSELSIYKTDVNYKLQDLPDEQVRETMSQILEIHQHFLESMIDKMMSLVKDITDCCD